jgi:uncharacterized secreted protein with C-terminal beta-propeller domain
MNDDELDRALRAARPRSEADDGWAASATGDEALSGIRRRITAGKPSTVKPFALRRRPVLGLTAGLAAATAAAVTVGLLSTSGDGSSGYRPHDQLVLPTQGSHQGARPDQMQLVAYTSCDGMLAGLREHTAAHVHEYGLFGYGGYYYGGAPRLAAIDGVPTPAGAQKDAAAAPSVPDHSTTNVQEVGVGEPDIVETDGTRIVSVSGGVLRVVDAASHKITGTLDLSMYAGADDAQLLMSGNRVLVLLGETTSPIYYDGPAIAYPYRPAGSGGKSTFLLVDLASDQPTIISTLHANGGYLDARMVGDTVRLVVQSSPKLVFPNLRGKHSTKERTARNREVIEHAPLSAWLPTYDVTAHGRTTTNTVPCTDVSHPAHYTGRSLLTVFSVNLSGDLSNPQPLSLATDGASVYASTSSLYVAAARPTKDRGELTQLDRFDITGSSKPVYLGSNMVSGTLLDSYSMSEYNGALRVVTTSGSWSNRASTAVYVLDADSLKVLGSVGGLGRGEQVHAVRFLGALAYVVTYESVDPLYVLDLHDPAHPALAGSLTITGYSDYLHPVSDGRLLGIGESVNSRGIVDGLQVSLFDVDSPQHPTRLSRVTQKHTPSETPIDPHAFLYWPARRLAVIPIDSWNERQSGAALAVHVDGNHLSVVGTIRNPSVSTADSYDTGIERTLVIGNDIWTMSSSGLQVSDLGSLEKRAWVPFA